MLPEEKHIKLMDYLYGEMSAQEKEAFEKELENSPELQAELAEMKGTQELLQVEPEISTPQPLILDTSPKQNRIRALPRGMLKIVASILILFIFAYVFQLNISFDNGALSIRFGEEVKEEKVAMKPKKNIDKKLEEKLLKYLEKQEKNDAEKWIALEQKLQKLQKSNSQKLPKPILKDNFSLAEVQVLISEARSKDLTKLNDLIEQSNIKQEKRIRGLLQEYDAYLSERRREDLKAIAMDLANLQESQYIQQEETEYILAELVQTLNTEENHEKN